MLIDNPSSDDAPTLSEAAARRLRQDIVGGGLPPATRLRLRDLSARYGLGATPLREALARLAAEGFVMLEGQKGFSVPPVTRAHLLDITRSRQVVEPEALRLAMEQGREEWEDGIVASLSLLRHEIGRRDPASEEWVDAYEARHHRFHRALIAACPLPSLLRFCDDLYLQKTRYRRLMETAHQDWARMLAVHESLAESVLARSAEAPALLASHIGVTAELVLALLGEAPPGKALSGG
ncbi:DNA-binding transcriptional regulator, GntR family [Roseomonas rosea]|uniref:DNA-binding transcriptional regulator, GntR family n=1 Tax=Muricoccus roseus TaxID=198092 RepID=A0A1M6LQF7_9PROT|nr:GntR family transcriptional regulator [Roseomonas rosea]SHJ73434.1 DNA-binding transcriptional regulator, GntR family [Roseomonas rosea]